MRQFRGGFLLFDSHCFLEELAQILDCFPSQQASALFHVLNPGRFTLAPQLSLQF